MTMKTKLRQYYENACNTYLKIFCKKHGYDYGPTDWVDGDVGGFIEVGDERVDLQTMLTNIDLNAAELETSQRFIEELRKKLKNQIQFQQNV